MAGQSSAEQDMVTGVGQAKAGAAQGRAWTWGRVGRWQGRDRGRTWAGQGRAGAVNDRAGRSGKERAGQGRAGQGQDQIVKDRGRAEQDRARRAG